ncbi:MAG: ABC transporter substrate-binding protein [Chloroflexota bacterium]|nr:MAG: ABC transporter substrate-binding protein [Chloroflexota bacterium]
MKKIAHGITVLLLLSLLLAVAPLAALAQEEVVCEADAIVQSEDSLSTLADKYYGNIFAYPVIVDATNAKAATDSSYATIDDPNVIETGSKLCIPPGEVAQQMLNESVFTAVGDEQAATTLVIGITEDTVALDPGRSYEVHAGTVNRAVYETLVTFPPDNVEEVIPGAAESWTISEDGLTYTFTMAQGHKFSTGRTVTANDAAFSINRMKNIKGNPSFLADNIASVEAADEQTLVIKLTAPDPSLLARLVFPAFSVIDSEEAKAHGATDAADAAETDTAEEWLNQNSIGSGPYMYEKWEPLVEVILNQNPNYAGEPAPIDRVIYRTISTAAAQKLALEAGDLDIALDISADQVPSLESNANLTLYKGQGDQIFFLLMNMDPAIGGPMTQDVVQDAVRLAVDTDGIRQLMGGSAATPVNILPVHWPFALDQSQRIQRNVDAAKAKLAEAGFADGLTVELEYPDFTSGDVAIGTLAQKVQADLAEAGINVVLKPGDLQVTLERYRNGQENFGLWLWSPDFIDPIDRIAFTPGGKVGLRANWTEERASRELNEAVARAKVVTDRAAREQAFADIQRIMLDESAFAFLGQSGVQVAYRTDLQGFVYNAMWRVNPYTMSK